MNILKDKLIDIKHKIQAINYRKLLAQLLLIAAIMGVFFIPIYFIFQKVDSDLWNALSSGNAEAMTAAIEKYDNQYGIILVAILQIVQDLVIIIPSAAVHLVAGMVLGGWKGFIVCHIADIFTNMFVFFVYSKLKKYLDKIITFDDSNKTVRMIQHGKSPSFMVVLVCILPAVPNGCIPYAAVNAKMKISSYTLAVTFGCAIPTFVMVMLGNSVFEANLPLMIVLIALSFIGVFFLLKYQHHILKAIEKAKYNTMMKITEEIPEAERGELESVNPSDISDRTRRYKLTHKVVTLSEMKYQDIPLSDENTSIAAFFGFKRSSGDEKKKTTMN